ncbi:MAG: Lipopolysaccharide export system ATP-binding protein LptB [Acidimicrobiales bacterium]|nr:MAG: ABC transporter ATP-binding protein [Actinomycetota bacterium]MBV6507840.1 Lipopolysaccharide export system ATP-binding protein LptB [Acidimicrobiales bacterium]RIK05990.1 MAG: ABC transporter ATP-binding protein [Acidobacteriota bacterium]
MSLLEARGVTVRFGGHIAVKQVDLDVDAGRITGLIGPNGAGKTTLFNVITGLQDTVEGSVSFDGREISRLAPHKRARLGMARTFQRLEVFGSLTARENILAAAEFRNRYASARMSAAEMADIVLEIVGLRSVASERADSLPTGQARLIELGRALASEPKLLLLDEPASGLSEVETDQLANLLVRLAEAGLGILLVEHDMPLVMRVCQVIAVLDFGSILAQGPPEQIRQNPQVLEAYLGSHRH